MHNIYISSKSLGSWSVRFARRRVIVAEIEPSAHDPSPLLTPRRRWRLCTTSSEGVARADARAFAISHGAAAEIGDERALATLLDDLFGDAGGGSGVEAGDGGGGSGGTGSGPRGAARYAQPSTKPIHWETLHAGDDKLTHDSIWRRESERGRTASVALLPEDELEVGN